MNQQGRGDIKMRHGFQTKVVRPRPTSLINSIAAAATSYNNNTNNGNLDRAKQLTSDLAT